MERISNTHYILTTGTGRKVSARKRLGWWEVGACSGAPTIFTATLPAARAWAANR